MKNAERSDNRRILLGFSEFIIGIVGSLFLLDILSRTYPLATGLLLIATVKMAIDGGKNIHAATTHIA